MARHISTLLLQLCCWQVASLLRSVEPISDLLHEARLAWKTKLNAQARYGSPPLKDKIALTDLHGPLP
eukprot:3005039-Amphidinium_carterae.1